MMNLMLLPDWNSLDSVRRVHSDLEAGGLIFFALLVVAEAVSHSSKDNSRKHLFDAIGIWFFAIAVLCEIAGFRYGQRNDELSEQVIVSLDAKAQHASNAAGAAQTKADVAKATADKADATSLIAKGRANRVAAEADRISRVLGLEVSLANARQIQNGDELSAEWKKTFKGRKIQLVSYAGDAEAWGVCERLVTIARNAEMIPEDICGKAWFTSPLISPLSITTPNVEEMSALGNSLIRIGKLGSTSTFGPNLVIFVGIKSPFIIGETDQTQDAAKSAAAMNHAKSKSGP